MFINLSHHKYVCFMSNSHFPKSLKIVRNGFLEKSYSRCGGVASPRSFHKKIKIKHISESTVSNVTMFTFIVCPYRGLPKYIKTKVLTTCF